MIFIFLIKVHLNKNVNQYFKAYFFNNLLLCSIMSDKTKDTEKKLKEMAEKATNPKIKASIETKISQLGKEVTK